MMERRSRRSPLKNEALNLFLEEQRRSLRVQSLIVTTRSGRMLGSAGTTGGRTRGRKACALGTWALRAGDIDVVVTSHGGRLSHELGAGVKRILTT
jgi:hypothetical protein